MSTTRENAAAGGVLAPDSRRLGGLQKNEQKPRQLRRHQRVSLRNVRKTDEHFGRADGALLRITLAARSAERHASARGQEAARVRNRADLPLGGCRQKNAG